MSETILTITDEKGSYTPVYSKLSIFRDATTPARQISVDLPLVEWRGEAITIEFSSESYSDIFLVDLHQYQRNGQGVLQHIEGRSKLGALLLENQVYPRTYQNIDMATLILRTGGIYGLRKYEADYNASLALYMIEDSSSAWKAITDFVRLAYRTECYFLEEDIVRVGTPSAKSSFIFSNLRDGAIRYSDLEYTAIPNARISKIQGLDTAGDMTTYTNLVKTYREKCYYRRNPTDYSQAATRGHNEEMIKSLWDSYKVTVSIPGFFIGAPNDKGVFLDVDIPGPWQMESGQWIWENGWSSRLNFKNRNYQGG